MLLAVAQPLQVLEEVAVTPSSLMPWAAVAVAADAWAVAGAGLSEEQVMVYHKRRMPSEEECSPKQQHENPTLAASESSWLVAAPWLVARLRWHLSSAVSSAKA